MCDRNLLAAVVAMISVLPFTSCKIAQENGAAHDVASDGSGRVDRSTAHEQEARITASAYFASPPSSVFGQCNGMPDAINGEDEFSSVHWVLDIGSRQTGSMSTEWGLLLPGSTKDFVIATGVAGFPIQARGCSSQDAETISANEVTEMDGRISNRQFLPVAAVPTQKQLIALATPGIVSTPNNSDEWTSDLVLIDVCARRVVAAVDVRDAHSIRSSTYAGRFGPDDNYVVLQSMAAATGRSRPSYRLLLVRMDPFELLDSLDLQRQSSLYSMGWIAPGPDSNHLIAERNDEEGKYGFTSVYGAFQGPAAPSLSTANFEIPFEIHNDDIRSVRISADLVVWRSDSTGLFTVANHQSKSTLRNIDAGDHDRAHLFAEERRLLTFKAGGNSLAVWDLTTNDSAPLYRCECAPDELGSNLALRIVE